MTQTELAKKFQLNRYLSNESLEKLLSPETQQKAQQISDLKSLQDFLDNLSIPELGSDIVIIDDGPGLKEANPDWGTCFGDDPLHYPFIKGIDRTALKRAVDNYESYRFSPKAPGSKSSRNTATEGATLGAAVGVALSGAAGAAGVVAGGVGLGAVAAAIAVGAVAGALGAKISEALKD